jgi:hypothetical protein
MSVKFEMLLNRAEAILEGKENGLGMPILRALALRRFGPAMLSLAARQTEQGARAELGRISESNSPICLMYRAFRQGETNAAQNLALSLFYVGDLAGYRHWLRRAARGGDAEAWKELKRFEVRQPWPLARKIKRQRPFRRDGS